jgi:hypothetical protein
MRALFVIMLASCGPTTATVELHVDPLPPSPVATAVATSAPQHVPTDAMCVPHGVSLSGCRTIAHVRIGPITPSRSSCYVDTIVRTGGEGELLACPDNAVIRMENGNFIGAINDDRIDTCTSTTFHFTDGCDWRSIQRISGSTKLGMYFTYREGPVSGDQCASSSCTARGRVEILP